MDSSTRDVTQCLTTFEALYDHCHRLVYAYLLRNSHSPETAKDLAQDTWARAWQAWPSLEHHSDKLTICWIMRIATNVLRDLMRQRKLIEWSQFDPDAQYPDSADTAKTAIAVAESFPRLSAAFNAISRRQRRVLALAAQGYTTRAIAASTGSTRTATRAALYRARVRLRAALATD